MLVILLIFWIYNLTSDGELLKNNIFFLTVTIAGCVIFAISVANIFLDLKHLRKSKRYWNGNTWESNQKIL